MTLLEVLLALAILAVLVLLLVSGLRVGLRAWEAADRRAARQQETRALVELLTGALASAFPYYGRLGEAPRRVLLFEGEAAAVRFVTAAPPLALDAPAAPFHAVSVALGEGGLRLVERLVPADEPFGEESSLLLSGDVTGLTFEYLDEDGRWRSEWRGEEARALPVAVRVELEVRRGGRTEALPPFVVPIALGRGAA